MVRQPRSTPTASTALEKHLTYLRGKRMKLETKWIEASGAIDDEIESTERALAALGENNMQMPKTPGGNLEQ